MFLKKDLSTECKLSVPQQVHHPLIPALPSMTHQARGSDLRADDLPRPGLVFCPWVEMCDLHLHRLHLQVLGRDSAHFVRHLVALNWDVLPLDAETEKHVDDGTWVKMGSFASHCLVV